jgi:hypothetical protein
MSRAWHQRLAKSVGLLRISIFGCGPCPCLINWKLMGCFYIITIKLKYQLFFYFNFLQHFHIVQKKHRKNQFSEIYGVSEFIQF